MIATILAAAQGGGASDPSAPWSTLLSEARDLLLLYGLNVLWALVLFFVGKWIARRLTVLLRRTLERRRVDATLSGFLANVAFALLLTLVVLAVLGKLGVNTTSFVAVLGAAGLAVGFALQGSLANFASGVMIIALRPFRVGDFVEAGGTTGSVEEVQLFATMLKTPDNKRVFVPNAAITGGNITNFSAKETRRVDLVFGIGYGDDLRKAKELLQRMLAADERVLKEPAPVVAVSELGESSVNFVVRPWVKAADYWSLHWDLTERVKLEFDANGISIPFPQRDVHLHQVA